MAREISLLVEYERHSDGCYFIRCESLLGFRLAVPDIDALQRDLNTVVSDFLLHNMGFEVESIRWVPSPEDVKRHLVRPSPEGSVIM